MVCDDAATFAIKDSSNYYCTDCAKDNFSDLAMLIKVEEIAKNLKDKLDEYVDQLAEIEDNLEEEIDQSAEVQEQIQANRNI